jgi:hypothetical protein
VRHLDRTYSGNAAHNIGNAMPFRVRDPEKSLRPPRKAGVATIVTPVAEDPPLCKVHRREDVMRRADQPKALPAVLAGVKHGSHICAFYETNDDLIDLVLPFFTSAAVLT